MIALGCSREQLADRHGRRHDLAEDVALADPPGDQLGVLRPVVDDENRVIVHHQRQSSGENRGATGAPPGISALMMTIATPAPNFLVVGAPRAATTSLHYYLAQHPDVCMSTIKEPNYFLFDQEGDGRPVRRRRPADHRQVGPQAGRVREALHAAGNRDRRGVAALPLHRADARSGRPDAARTCGSSRSCATPSSARCRTSPTCGTAVRTPSSTASRPRSRPSCPLADSPYRPGTHHLRLGRYAAQLRRWEAVVSRDRLLVLDYRELTGSAPTAMRQVSEFLDVDPDFTFDTGDALQPIDHRALTPRCPAGSTACSGPAVPHLKRALPGRGEPAGWRTCAPDVREPHDRRDGTGARHACRSHLAEHARCRTTRTTSAWVRAEFGIESERRSP